VRERAHPSPKEPPSDLQLEVHPPDLPPVPKEERLRGSVSNGALRTPKASPKPKIPEIVTSEPANGQRKAMIVDGNTNALETEYADVLAPAMDTFETAVPDEDEERIKLTARDIFDGTETMVAMNEASIWLMRSDEYHSKVRTAYMELFDFMGLDVLSAMRYISARGS
jgi:hypothetical protein